MCVCVCVRVKLSRWVFELWAHFKLNQCIQKHLACSLHRRPPPHQPQTMVCFDDEGGYLRTIGLIVASLGYLLAPFMAGKWWYALVISPSVSSFGYFFLMAEFPDTFTAAPEKMVGWIVLFSVALVVMIGAMSQYAMMVLLATATGIPFYNNSALIGHWLSTNISPYLSVVTGAVILALILGMIGGILWSYGVLDMTIAAMDILLKIIVASVIQAFFIDVAWLERKKERELCFGSPATDTTGRCPLAFDRPATFSLLAACGLISTVMVYQVHTRGFCAGAFWPAADGSTCFTRCCRSSETVSTATTTAPGPANVATQDDEGEEEEEEVVSRQQIIMIPMSYPRSSRSKKRHKRRSKHRPRPISESTEADVAIEACDSRDEEVIEFYSEDE